MKVLIHNTNTRPCECEEKQKQDRKATVSICTLLRIMSHDPTKFGGLCVLVFFIIFFFETVLRPV